MPSSWHGVYLSTHSLHVFALDSTVWAKVLHLKIVWNAACSENNSMPVIKAEGSSFVMFNAPTHYFTTEQGLWDSTDSAPLHVSLTLPFLLFLCLPPGYHVFWLACMFGCNALCPSCCQSASSPATHPLIKLPQYFLQLFAPVFCSLLECGCEHHGDLRLSSLLFAWT